MPDPLVPVITDAGLAAAFTADNTGIAAEITHIAFGTSGYTPDSSMTTLGNEVARVAIADGERADTHQIHLTALLSGAQQFWVREVGFVLSDGTLLAIWSDPVKKLAYKSDGVDILLGFDILLQALPAESINVTSTGANLSLYYAEQFAEFATVLTGSVQRDYDQAVRDDDLQEQLRIQKNAINYLSRAVIGRDLI